LRCEKARRIHVAGQRGWRLGDVNGIRSFYISGGIVADAAFGSAALNEFTTLWPILYGIVLLVLIITLRAFSAPSPP
jgi:hypothetical protein